jgi:uncharacterized membrane protein (DUF106 family)
MVFESVLNPIFNPLLNLPITWVVVIMALIITFIITIIYKFTTNQNLMKELKGEMKELQKEMKELKSDPSKMMEVQKKAMQTNMKYMSHSMRSMLFTFIPIILIFGWMNAHLAYEQIAPGQDFTTTIEFYKGVTGEVELVVPDGITMNGEAVQPIDDGEVKWILSGEEGNYLLEYKVNGKSYTKDLLITQEPSYAKPIEVIKDKTVMQISIDNIKMKVFNLFGWQIGWLGSYIIMSIIFSMILRKLFKVY